MSSHFIKRDPSFTYSYRLVEITSAGTGFGTGRLAQFVVGRIVVYISVGLVEVNVTCGFQVSKLFECSYANINNLVLTSLKLFQLLPEGLLSSLCNSFSQLVQSLPRSSTKLSLQPPAPLVGKLLRVSNSYFQSVSKIIFLKVASRPNRCLK